MKLPNLPTIILLGLVIGCLYWGVDQCSQKSRATEQAQQLRDAKRTDSTFLIVRALLSEREAANLKAQRDEATARALQDEADRSSRDQQTALLFAMMNRPTQETAALRGLIENGFLHRDRYRDTTTGFTPDSAFVASVAVQGQVLRDTRAEVSQIGLALRSTQTELRDVKDRLTFQSAGIGTLRSYVQDERSRATGLWARPRRRVLDQIDARIGVLLQPLPPSSHGINPAPTP